MRLRPDALDEIHDALLTDIKRFCELEQMGETTFGRVAMGDPNFVRTLRQGRAISSPVLRRALEFIEEHEQRQKGPRAA